MDRRIVQAVVLGGGIVVISTAAILIKLCDDAPAAVIAAGRMTTAAIVLLPVGFATRGRRLVAVPRHCRPYIALGGVFLAAHFFFWMASLKHTSVASSVVIVTTNPLFIGLASYFLFKERIGRGLVVGIILAIVGGALVAVSDTQAGAGSLRGDLLSLLGAIMASCYLLTGRRVRREVDTLSYILPVYGIAAILLCALAVARGELFIGYSSATYLWLVLLGLGPQLVGHSTLNWGLKRLSATFIAICILGEPIGASVLAYFVLGEKATSLQVAGGVLILAGIFLAARAQFGAAQRN